MNEFSSDEPPKFVITPRACKLPAALLMAAHRDAHASSQKFSSVLEPVAAFTPGRGQPALYPSRGSPRERRMTTQLLSESLPATSESLSDTSSGHACRVTRSFPREWGSPPCKLSPVQAQLPEGYGVGSVTLRSWMLHRLHGGCEGKAAAGSALYDDETILQREPDEAALAGISSRTRRMMQHPDVPWAPGGGSWSDFRAKIELEKQKQRREREGRDRSADNEARVLPIVPPLLLEPCADLLRARSQQNRPVTPLSTRQLLHQLQQRSVERQQPRAPGSDGQQVVFSVAQADAASQGTGAPCATALLRQQAQTPELLPAVAHKAALTQGYCD
jgi:hypothetical protein